MTERGTLDCELARITSRDRLNADEMISDFLETEGDRIHEVMAQWARKIRYEAVIADRASRADGEKEKECPWCKFAREGSCGRLISDDQSD